MTYHAIQCLRNEKNAKQVEIMYLGSDIYDQTR